MAVVTVRNFSAELYEWTEKALVLTGTCLPQPSARTRGMEVAGLCSKACV